jgi:hypothetical protein
VLSATVSLCLASGCGALLAQPGEPAGGTGDPAAGEVRLLRNATSEFDPLIVEPTAQERRFMADTYSRMRAYPPFFDRAGALEWAPPTEQYQDLYAIYNREQGPGPANALSIRDHPDWVLRDSAGRPLFIPYDCRHGTCPAYAADPGNPEWRRDWIERARRELGKGYAGVHVDNVNMNRIFVGNGRGRLVRPIGPRTGQPMTLEDWRRYVAEFTELIDRELAASHPAATISHNPVWFAPEESPWVLRQIESTDIVELERGFSDAGLTGGDGRFSYRTLLDHVDWLHSLGKSFVIEPYDLDRRTRTLELASYLLVSDGKDEVATDHRADPGHFWPGWRTDLGAPMGARYEWRGLIRRDFEHGIALVNEPEADSVEVPFDEPLVGLDGERVSRLALGPHEGAVLQEPGSARGPVRR